MTGPELPTPAEEKQIAEIIEVNIDEAIEQKHIHEIEKPIDIDEGY